MLEQEILNLGWKVFPNTYNGISNDMFEYGDFLLEKCTGKDFNYLSVITNKNNYKEKLFRGSISTIEELTNKMQQLNIK
jgi:hypothetical protein